MSYRSTKRRKLNAEGEHVLTATDTLSDNLSTSGSSYYLRSSARRKRKFITTPIDDVEDAATEREPDHIKIDLENQENIAPSRLLPNTSTMLRNGKLSKIQNLKNLISSGISKITNPSKPEKNSNVITKRTESDYDRKGIQYQRCEVVEEGNSNENGKDAVIEMEFEPQNKENVDHKMSRKTNVMTKTSGSTTMTTMTTMKTASTTKTTSNLNSKQMISTKTKTTSTANTAAAAMRAHELENERVRALIQRVTAERKRKYEYDEKGYIVFHKNLVMNDRYLVQRRLGKGTFSKVFCCIDSEAADPSQRKKAIKVIRNQHKYQIAARTEARILNALKNGDPSDDFHVIKLVESCYFEQHPIFVFPLYGRSLYHYLYDNNFRPFPDSHIKIIAKQIVEAVAYTHSLGIIITDLKPENIIICNDDSERHLLGDGTVYYTLKSQKVRLIDFGSAVFDDPRGSVHHHLIQTRHYRSPEVMFKFNWSFSADIWSIGCVIVELANGKMLFNTHDTIDHLNQIVVAIGEIPDQILHQIDENVYNELFHFDGSLALHRATRSSVQCTKLKAYFHLKYHKAVYDLVRRMLTWSAETRITAQQALRHSWFSSNNGESAKKTHSA